MKKSFLNQIQMTAKPTYEQLEELLATERAQMEELRVSLADYRELLQTTEEVAQSAEERAFQAEQALQQHSFATTSQQPTSADEEIQRLHARIRQLETARRRRRYSSGSSSPDSDHRAVLSHLDSFVAHDKDLGMDRRISELKGIAIGLSPIAHKSSSAQDIQHLLISLLHSKLSNRSKCRSLLPQPSSMPSIESFEIQKLMTELLDELNDCLERMAAQSETIQQKDADLAHLNTQLTTLRQQLADNQQQMAAIAAEKDQVHYFDHSSIVVKDRDSLVSELKRREDDLVRAKRHNTDLLRESEQLKARIVSLESNLQQVLADKSDLRQYESSLKHTQKKLLEPMHSFSSATSVVDTAHHAKTIESLRVKLDESRADLARVEKHLQQSQQECTRHSDRVIDLESARLQQDQLIAKLTTDVEKCTSARDRYRGMLNKAELVVKEHEARIAHLHNQMNALEMSGDHSARELKKQLLETDKKLQQALDSKFLAEQHATGLEESVERAHSRLAEAERQLLEMKQANADLQARLAEGHSKHAEVRRLKEELVKAQEAAANMETELRQKNEVVHSELDTTQSHLAVHLSSVHELRNSLTRTETMLKSMQSEYAALEKNYQDALKKSSDLETQLMDVQSQSTELAQTLERVSEQKTRELNSRDDRIELLSSELERAKQQQLTMSEAALESDVLRKEIDEISAKYSHEASELQMEIDRLKEVAGDKVREANRYEKEVQTLRSRQTEAEDMIAKLSDEVRAVGDQLVSAQSREKELQSSLGLLENERQQLKNELVQAASKNGDVSALQSKIALADEKIRTLQSELSHAQETISRLNVEIEKARAAQDNAIDELARINEESSQKISELSAKLEESLSAATRYQESCEKAESDVRELTARCEDLEMKNMELTGRIDDLEVEQSGAAVELRQQLAQLEKSLEDANSKALELELQNKAAEEAVEVYSRGSKEAEDELQRTLNALNALRTEYASSQTRLSELESCVTDLEATRRSLETEKTNLETRLETASLQIRDLKGESAASKSDLSAQLERYQMDNERLRADLDERFSLIEQLKSNCAQMEMEIETKTKLISELDVQVKTLGASEQSAQTSIEERESKLSELGKRIEFLEKELASAHASVEKTTDELLEAMTANEKLESSVGVLSADLDQVRESLQVAEMSVQEKTSESETLRDEVNSMSEKLNGLHVVRQQLESQIKTLADTISTLESELASKDELMEQLVQENNQVGNKSHEAIQNLHARLVEKEEALKASLKSQSEHKLEIERLEARVSELKSKIEAVNNEKLSFVREVETVKRENDSVKQKLSVSTSRLESAQQENDHLSEEFARLRHDFEKAAATHAHEKSEADFQLSLARDESEALKKKQESFVRENAQLKRAIDETTRECQNLRQTIQRSEATHRSTHIRITELESERDGLLTQIDELRLRSADLDAKLLEQSKEILELRGRLEDENYDLQETQTTAANYRQQVNTLQRQVTDLKQANASLTEKCQEITRKEMDMRKRLSNIQRERDALAQEKQDLVEQKEEQAKSLNSATDLMQLNERELSDTRRKMENLEEDLKAKLKELNRLKETTQSAEKEADEIRAVSGQMSIDHASAGSKLKRFKQEFGTVLEDFGASVSEHIRQYEVRLAGVTHRVSAAQESMQQVAEGRLKALQQTDKSRVDSLQKMKQLTDAVNEANARLDSQQNKMETIRLERDQLKLALNETRLELQLKDDECSAISNRLAQLEKEKESMTRHYEESVAQKFSIMESQLASSKHALEVKTAMVRDLSQQLNDSINERQKTSIRLEETEEKLSDLDIQHQTLLSHIEARDSEIKELSFQLKSSREEFAVLKSRYEQLESWQKQAMMTEDMRIVELERELDHVQAQLKASEASLDEYKVRLAAKDVALEEKGAAAKELVREKSELHSSVEKFKATLKEDSDQIAQLQHEVESCRRLIVELPKQYETRIHELQTEHTALSVEKQELLIKLRSLERSAVDTEQEIATLATQRDLLQSEVKSSKNALEDLNTLLANSSPNDMVKELREKLENKTAEFAVANVHLEEVAKKLKQVESENSHLNESLEDLEARSAHALNALKGELAEVTKQYSHYESMATDLHQVNEELRESLTETQDNLLKQQQTVTRLEEEREKLVGDLDDAKTKRASLEQTIAQLNEAIADLQLQRAYSKTIDNSPSKTIKEVAKLKEQIAEMTEEREKMLKAMDDFMASYKRHEESRKQLKKMVRSLQVEIDAKVGEIEKLGSRVSELESDNRKLVAELGRNTKENDFVIRQLNDAATALKEQQPLTEEDLEVEPFSFRRTIAAPVSNTRNAVNSFSASVPAHASKDLQRAIASAKHLPLEEIVARYEAKLGRMHRLLEKGEKALETGAEIFLKASTKNSKPRHFSQPRPLFSNEENV